MKGAINRTEAITGVSISVTAVPKATRIEAGSSRAVLTTVAAAAGRAVAKPIRPPTAPPSRAIEMIELAVR